MTDPDCGQSPNGHRWNEQGEYIGPYRSIDEVPTSPPLPLARCACGRPLDEAGACIGCRAVECYCNED